MKVFRSMPYILGGCLLFWGILFFLELSNSYPQDKISSISAFCEFFAHFFIILILFQILLKLSTENKKILAYLIVGNVCLLLMDVSFELSVYFPERYILSSQLLTVFSGYIPYLLFLLMFFVFLINILSSRTFSRLFLIKLIPLFFFLNVIVIFLFLSAIQYNFQYFSWQTVSHVICMIMEFIIFDLILVSLVYSECLGFSVFLIGAVVLMAGDFFISYSFLSQTSNMLGMGELLWFLGLLGNLFGFLFIKRDRNFMLCEWSGERNQIKNKLAIWCFAVSIISFLIFFTIAYYFSAISKQICLSLPLFIMAYSIFVILASIFVGKFFSSPFKKLEENVQSLILDNHASVHSEFISEEFSSLNKHILNAHYMREERDRVKKHLGEIASQLAHDIRSPLATINAIVNETHEIEEQKRIMLRNATQQLNDIANVLLVKYRSKDDSNSLENNSIRDSEVIAVLLDLIVSEKRLEYKSLPITINFDAAMSARGAFAQIVVSDFKRVISNIINNSVEAINEKGEIKISLYTSEKEVNIEITDSGIGMPPEIIEKVFNGSITSNKKEGSGIGLVSAYRLIKSWGGES